MFPRFSLLFFLCFFSVLLFSSVPLASSQVPTPFPNALFVGCVDLASGARLSQFLPSSSTPSICGNSTRSLGQALFGLSRGSLCSGEPNINLLQLNQLRFVPNSWCNQTCIANPSQYCGGRGAWAIYRHNFGPVVFSITPPLLPTSPAAGTRVTITGYNFVTFPRVSPVITFTELSTGAARNCPLQSGWNDTQLVCDLPAGQGYSLVDVKVGTLSMIQLPRFPQDFYFWTDSNRDALTANCVPTINSIEPEFTSHSWNNNYFCSITGTAGLLFVWSQTGPLADPSYTCLNWHSRSREPVVWNTMFLCYPKSIPYTFTWSENGILPGKGCLNIREPSCPGFNQGLNYLCAEQNEPLSITAPTGIDNRLKYQYSAPVISSVSPSGGPVAGLTTITVSGSSFGSILGSPTFTIGGNPCNIIPASYNATSFECVTPAGEGSNNLMQLSVAGLTSAAPMRFNYDPPSITGITPLNGPTNGGGVRITINGINFGLTEGQVYFDGILIPDTNVAWSNSQVLFDLPVGRDVNKTISLSSFPFGDPRSQVASSNRVYLFSYDPPSVTLLSPSVNAAKAGGNLIINGNNFGTSGDPSSVVRVGGSLCAPTGWTHNQITCIYSPTADAVSFVSVITGRQENAAGAASFIRFGAPMITALVPPAGYLSIPSSDYPLGMSSAPLLLTSLTVVGVNFGNGTNSIVANDPNFNRSTLTIGGRMCTIQPSEWFDNRVICALDAAFIQNLWAYQVPVEITNSQVRSNTLPFNFAPVIQSIFSPGFPTAGGTRITIQGSNFLLNSQSALISSVMSVAVKAFINQTHSIVYYQPIIDFSPDAVTQTINNITFNLPPGQGTGNCIYVRLGNFTSFCSKFDYTGPSISAISPTVGPASGGYLLTLWGNNFGFQPVLRSVQSVLRPSVLINNVPCPVFFQNHTYITCTVPSGAGISLPVQVSINAALRSNVLPFSYNAPVLYYLDPPVSPGSGNAINLTLVGDNFFSQSCSVNFNTINYAATPKNSTHIFFPLPPGAGAVPVYVVCGGISSNILTFVYSAPVISGVNPTTADTSGGITLTLFGSNFVANAQILVGGAICALDAMLPANTVTQMHCILPEGSGVNQNVTVQVGNVVSNNWPFSYRPPSITSFSPSNGPTNGNLVLLITGSSFGPTGTVTIGGVACVPLGSTYTHTSIRCSVPPGPPIGQNHSQPLVVTSNGQSSVGSRFYNYDFPSVSLVSPSTASTDGSTSIIIQGSNFGLSRTVTIGGSVCSISAASHNTIICTAPSLTGVNRPLIVQVNRRNSSIFLYSYTAPTYSAISRTNGSTGGGEQVVLTGQNLGAITNPPGSVRAFIGGRLASMQSVSPSSLTFLVPSGAGTNLPIRVDVNGQLVPSLPLFNYNPPLIRSFSPSGNCPTDPGVPGGVYRCPVAGAVLSINGVNFNTNTSLVQVIMPAPNGAIPCMITTLTDVLIVCSISRPEGGTRMPIYVTVAGQTSNTVNLVSFTGPVIAPKSINVVNLAVGSAVLITDLPTYRTISFNSSFGAPAPERQLSIDGSGFGTVAASVSVRYDYLSPQTLASLGSFNDLLFQSMSYNCSVVSVVDTRIICNLGDIIGRNLTFIVRVGLLYSTPSVDQIQGPPALILPNSISLVDLFGRRTPLSNSIVGVSSLGDLIDFNATYIGSIASKILVQYYQPGNPASLKVCDTTLVSTGIRRDGQFQYIRCKTAPGVGANYVFQIVTNSLLVSQPGTDYYSYTEPPIVDKVAGARDIGNATFDVPTPGGIVLSVYGSKFSANGLSVLIGDTPCISPNLISQNFLTCIAPSSTGLNLAVSVTVGTKISPFINAVSYSPASVNSISGCANGNTDCPRSGGQRINLAGANFGPPGPRPSPTIIVGGRICGAPIITGPQQAQVTCVLPPGTGVSQPVLYVQGRGPVTIANSTLSYAQCRPGFFAPPSNLTCSPCSPGRYTPNSGMSDCLPCPGGTFSNTNASACTFCPSGRFSQFDVQGNAICTDCDPGSFALAPGSAACSSCAPGRFTSSFGSSSCQDCAPGNYSLNPGSLSCDPCLAGQYSGAPGAVSCLPCPAGSISRSGQSVCTPCSAGTVADARGVACVNCPSGSYAPFSPSERCDLCPAGRFTGTAGQANCTLCAAGFSTGGLAGANQCQQCQIGRYTTGNGEEDCIVCPKGSFAAFPGSAICSPCLPGSFNDVIGNDRCTVCGPGKFVDFFGAIQCSLCDPGSFSLSNASTCGACSAGRFAPYPGASSCPNCLAGQFSGIGQPFCSDCSNGFFSPSGSSSCQRCSAGSFSIRGSGRVAQLDTGTENPLQPGDTTYQTTVFGSSVCTLCGFGSYADQTGSFTCQICSPGTFAPIQGAWNCTACSAGRYAPSSSSSYCDDCDAGRFSSQDGASQCDACPQGFASTALGVTVCQACSAGRFQEIANSASPVLSCSDCPLGTFASLPGQSGCLDCPAGSFAGQRNSTGCTLCPAGRYQPVPGMGDCIDAPAGSFASGTGNTNFQACMPGTFSASPGSANCSVCNPGEFSPTGSARCIACDPGFFSGVPGSPRCEPCPPGTAASSSGSSVCDACLPGFSQSSSGQPSCIPCSLGTFASTYGSLSCIECGGGSYSDTNSSTICSVCQPGSFSPAVSGSQPGATRCSLCSAGYFASKPGQPGCIACPIGKSSNTTGLSSCYDCDPGRFAIVEGSPLCQACDPGTFTASTASAQCLSCVAGAYQPRFGQTQCDVCAPGSYQDRVGQPQCTDCPSGRYSSSNGSIICSPCEAGSYNDRTGASECQACAGGTFNANPGASICQNCAPGTAAPPRSQSCQSCQPGTFARSGFDVCQPCQPGSSESAIGSQQCKLCPRGTFAAQGSTQCTPCPAGSIASASGSGSCIPCTLPAVADQLRITCQCPIGTAAQPLFNSSASTSNAFICADCPNGAECNQAGLLWDMLKASQGWWRTPRISRSDPDYDLCVSAGYCGLGRELNNFPLFYRCLNYQFCNGGLNEQPWATALFPAQMATTCSGNRVGPLCNLCRPGYIDSLGGLCVECTQSDGQQALLVFIILMLLAALSGMFYILLKANEALFALSYQRMFDEFHSLASGSDPKASATSTILASQGDSDVQQFIQRKEKEKSDVEALQRFYHIDPYDMKPDHIPHAKPNFTFKLKILIGFAQIVSNLAISLDIQWPTQFLQFISWLNPVNLDFVQVSNIGCVTDSSHYNKLIIICCIPPVMLVSMFLFWHLPQWFFIRQDHCKARILRQKTTLFFLYLLFLLYPFTSSTVIKTFVCRKIGNENYLVADMYSYCGTDEWNRYSQFAAVMIIVYPIGIPFLFGLILYNSRHNLVSPIVRATYGFLFDAFTFEYWYFELLDMWHKFMLTSILLLLPIGSQIPTGLALTGLYMIALLCFRPYLRKSDDRLHGFAQCELVLLFLSGYIFYQKVTYDEFYSILLSIVLIGLVIGFTMLFVVQSIQAYQRYRGKDDWKKMSENEKMKAHQSAQKILERELEMARMNEKAQQESESAAPRLRVGPDMSDATAEERRARKAQRDKQESEFIVNARTIQWNKNRERLAAIDFCPSGPNNPEYSKPRAITINESQNESAAGSPPPSGEMQKRWQDHLRDDD